MTADINLQSLNLALSNRCNAKCVWCPDTRGTKHYYDMPWDDFKKIIDEASTIPSISSICTGENGEAIYNKHFLDMHRYIRKTMPNHTIVSTLSNFGMFSRKFSKPILKERLLDTITVNIDGHDAASYESVKKISFKTVIKNLKTFLSLRAKYQPYLKVRINALPLLEYSLTIKNVLGAMPHQTTENTIPYSDFELVKKFLYTFVDPEDKNVIISHSKPGLWAERKLITSGKAVPPVDQSHLKCPLFDRVTSQAFIAPSGDWYACCFDDNNDLVLGNIKQQTLRQIYNSSTRQSFIEKLTKRQYEEIGYPCNTIFCCEIINVDPEILNSTISSYSNQKLIPANQI